MLPEFAAPPRLFTIHQTQNSHKTAASPDFAGGIYRKGLVANLFPLGNKLQGVVGALPNQQASTGLLHLNGSSPPVAKNKGRLSPPFIFWYTGRDSNPQPSEPESDALSIEPPVHLLFSQIIIAVFSSFVKRKDENIFCLAFGPWHEKGCFPPTSVV